MSFVLLQWVLGVRYPGDRPVMALCFPFIMVVTWTLLASFIMPRLFMNEVMVWPQKTDAWGGGSCLGRVSAIFPRICI